VPLVFDLSVRSYSLAVSATGYRPSSSSCAPLLDNTTQATSSCRRAATEISLSSVRTLRFVSLRPALPDPDMPICASHGCAPSNAPRSSAPPLNRPQP